MGISIKKNVPGFEKYYDSLKKSKQEDNHILTTSTKNNVNVEKQNYFYVGGNKFIIEKGEIIPTIVNGELIINWVIETHDLVCMPKFKIKGVQEFEVYRVENFEYVSTASNKKYQPITTWNDSNQSTFVPHDTYEPFAVYKNGKIGGLSFDVGSYDLMIITWNNKIVKPQDNTRGLYVENIKTATENESKLTTISGIQKIHLIIKKPQTVNEFFMD